MRISDWSSDVCSSDLDPRRIAMMTRTLILALSFAAAGIPAAAQAEDRTATVRIDDPDLTRPTDRERLATSLKSAARSVCAAHIPRSGERHSQEVCPAGSRARADPHVSQAGPQASRKE